VRHVWFEQLIVNDGRIDTPVCEPERTVAMLQYTGGTTGTPKGAELTHANLYVNAVQAGRWFAGCRPGQERILGVLPLFHIFGMATVMNVGLLLGAELTRAYANRYGSRSTETVTVSPFCMCRYGPTEHSM